MSDIATTTAVRTVEGVELPAAGTWTIDGSHTHVGFRVKHLGLAKVRGRFTGIEGAVEVGERPEDSSVRVSIDATSVDTHDENRDNHLRSADFFSVAEHPTMTYRSTAVRPAGDGWVVEGELDLHGVTRRVDLELELNGTSSDPWGNTRAGFSATTEINRKDFGIDIHMPLDGGGVVVGDKIKVSLEIEAILQQQG